MNGDHPITPMTEKYASIYPAGQFTHRFHSFLWATMTAQHSLTLTYPRDHDHIWVTV